MLWWQTINDNVQSSSKNMWFTVVLE